MTCRVGCHPKANFGPHGSVEAPPRGAREDSSRRRRQHGFDVQLNVAVVCATFLEAALLNAGLGFVLTAVCIALPLTTQSATVRSSAHHDEVVKVRWLHTPMLDVTDMPPIRCGDDRAPPPPGSALLECRLNANGIVTACVVLSETPKECAYGKDALRRVQGLKAESRTVDGRRIRAGMKVRIPWKFVSAPDESPP